MPKIPTFESQARPTAEVASLKTQFQVPVESAGSMFGSAQKVISAVDEYYVREQALKDKTESTKAYLELSNEIDTIEQGAIKNIDPSKAESTFKDQFSFLAKQKINSMENKAAARLLEDKLSLDLITRSSKVVKGSRDQLDLQYTNSWNNEQQLNMAKYTITEDENEKNIYKSQLEQGIISRNFYFNDGPLKLEQDLKKNNAVLIEMDVDRLINKEKYAEAKSFLLDLEKTKDLDSKKRADFLDKIEKQSGELNENNYVAANLIKGNNVLIGANFKKTTEAKAIKHTENILFNEAQKNNKNEEETFAYVDEVMTKNGIISPTYKSLMEAGFNAGSITTFDSPSDIPNTLLQAVKAAEVADKFKRLNVYANKEQERFYKNIILLKQVKGLDNYQAIKQAKEFEQNYDVNILKGSTKQREKIFESIESKFKDSKSTNINELRGYAGQLYDMYIMLGIDDSKAAKQVVKDIESNIIEIDDYSYLKRDIVPFQAIDGIENIPVYKKYIIKNNLEKGEDPDDYYLRHNGGGQFEIRRKVDLSTVYNKENNPMIFYAKDLIAIKNQQTEEFKKDIIEQQRKTQQLRIFITEQESYFP